MKVDSLDELTSAFAEWRSGKKHAREPIPGDLLARARRTAKKHGVPAVVRVTRVERARLFRNRQAHSESQGSKSTTRRGLQESGPTFSRLELSAPSVARPRPIAEVEMAAGLTLRVFEPTPEMLQLLSAVCGCGGAQ